VDLGREQKKRNRRKLRSDRKEEAVNENKNRRG
jgi:hypothetical protein